MTARTFFSFQPAGYFWLTFFIAFSPSATAIRPQFVATQFIGGNNEYTFAVLAKRMNDLQVSSGGSLPEGNPRIVVPFEDQPGPCQNFTNFRFGHAVLVDVRQAGFEIDEEFQL